MHVTSTFKEILHELCNNGIHGSIFIVYSQSNWQAVYSNTHRNPLRAMGVPPDNSERDWQQKGAGYGT